MWAPARRVCLSPAIGPLCSAPLQPEEGSPSTLPPENQTGEKIKLVKIFVHQNIQ